MDKISMQYSMGGMAQYYSSPVDLVGPRITESINTVLVNTSVQPNSIPHFGTVTTIIGAFIFALQVKERFGKNVIVEVDFIDCGPSANYHRNGGDFCLSIEKTTFEEESGSKIADHYINEYYIPLLKWISARTNINYKTRRYREFQQEYAVRKATIEIVNDADFFSGLLAPVSGKPHLRAECPRCGMIDKMMKHTYLTTCANDRFVISSCCPVHGEFDVEISLTNSTFFEANTQIRDIVKGALMQYYHDHNTLGIMYDGGDWGGTWTHHVHCIALQRLGYTIPLRLFAPLILDWSGGKLSKSIYTSTYDKSIIDDYEVFLKNCGENGMRELYDEVFDWVSSSKKFFRNYSLEYILRRVNKLKN